MLGRLTEAIIHEEESQLNNEQLSDGIVIANATPVYKRLSYIDDSDKLPPEEQEDLTNRLKSVDLNDNMTRDEKVAAVIQAVK